MGSRSSVFVESSSTWTLRFDVEAQVTAAPERHGPNRLVRRLAVGAVTSAAIVLAAAGVSAATSGSTADAPAPAPSPVIAPRAVAALAAEPAGTDIYAQAAATCPGLPAPVLEAIHAVETGGAVSGTHRSSKGALGPMQFLPATWDAYGIDADGDGRADIHDVDDAVFTAASYLCTNGGGDRDRLATAVWNYNRSWSYVNRVLDLARTRPQ